MPNLRIHEIMEQRLIDPLTALETSLTNLVNSLVATNTFTVAPKAARDLVAADEDLSDALIVLKKHQDNYQDILRMRAERENLRNKLKETVYECVRLKNDLRDIDSRIVDESDTEDEESSADQNPIDYETLIAFASRIGKHNAIAAQEAQVESDRLHEEARKQREEKPSSQALLNGVNGGDTLIQTTSDRPTTSHSFQTREAEAKAKEFRNVQSFERSRKTAPYPDQGILRFGVLGQLQVIREDAGDDAVQAHLEKLIRESELKAPTKPAIEPDPVEKDKPDDTVAPRSDERRPAAPVQRPQAPPKPVINLDLPDSDDDSDDD